MELEDVKKQLEKIANLEIAQQTSELENLLESISHELDDSQ